MRSWAEARAAFTGLMLLLRFDAGFVNWFDRSPEGARRSFRLMVPMLPVFLFRLFTEVDLASAATPLLAIVTIGTCYVLGWVMFPLILILVGRAIERETQAIGALSSYNWFGAGLSVIACALSLVESSGALGGIPSLLFSALIIASLVYETYQLHVLMGIGYIGAGILAIVDYTLAQSLFVLLLSPVVVVPTS
ncbi:hypothetical protein [Dongia sp.]|uniref:hypothetical protein n=1 Tax=Dongia sp. TaxID=1977262 RepID=UPI0035B454D8